MAELDPRLNDISSLVRAAARGWLTESSDTRRGYAEPAERDERVRNMLQHVTTLSAAPSTGEGDLVSQALALGAEVVAESLNPGGDGRRSGGDFSPGTRVLVAVADGIPAVLVLDPGRRFSETAAIGYRADQKLVYEAGERLRRDAIALPPSPQTNLLDQLGMDAGELVATVRPEIILTSLPKMERLCVPTPFLSVECNGESSTAGLFCRDAEGTLGVTACYHGTGPVGTKVQVGLRETIVKHASEVQDIVFLPLPEDYNLPEFCAKTGVLADETPPHESQVHFEGAKSGAVATRVSSGNSP